MTPIPLICFRYSMLLLVIAILGCTTTPSVEAKHARCIETEARALLDFKKSFTSTYLAESKVFSWNSTEKDCCEWHGITCNNHGYVVSLHLGFELLVSYQIRPSLLELHHLRRLDLSWNDFAMRIPEFIGSLSKLTYLNLSHSGFHGKVPPHLGNLSRLQTLVLSSQDNSFYVDNFRWVSRLSRLESLDMSYVNLSDARDWLSSIGMLPLLSSFNCSSCLLPPPSFSDISVNSSTSLEIIDLSNNILSSSLGSWLQNSGRNVLELYLSNMKTESPFPNLFQNMVSLRTLQLSGNHLEQGTLESIGSLCSLKELVVSNCVMNQSLTEILQNMSSCAGSSLESLHLGSNNLTGTFPSMMKFPSLRQLNLSSNQLNNFSLQDSSVLPRLHALDISMNDLKNLPEILRHLPSSLKALYLSSNSFNDVISDTQVFNFTKLKTLDLSNNPTLTLNLTKPPFQLDYIGLKSCGLGPDFPNWLLTQKNFSWLDISNSMISGSIPLLFWKNLHSSLSYLDLSSNKFHDTVPNLQFPFPFPFATIDLSSNTFYGPIPSFLFSSNELLLSNNHFSAFAPLPYPSNSKPEAFSIFTDLSYNILSGTVPSWFWECQKMAIGLSLANNRLSGEIASSIGSLSHAHFLSLSNNSFSGELPLSLKNCINMGFLDLSGNKFTGYIPDWIGESLTRMTVLLLRSNNFSGNMPSTLCHISPLQVLDLSHNKLSGNIPSCVYNFTTMTSDDNSMPQVASIVKALPIVYRRMEALFSYTLFDWKGKDRTFGKELTMLISIDLSYNDLSGEIPIEVTSLVMLNSLNLRSNNLSGSIPANIGRMTSLESLNLAWNKLCGEIPSSLDTLTFLSELDVSHNNLSGKIPISTQLQSFSSSAYAGNLELCGLPLPIKCAGDGEPVPQPSITKGNEKQNKWDVQSFYGALGTGFAIGLVAILGAINFFQFANDCVNSILVAALRVLRYEV